MDSYNEIILKDNTTTVNDMNNEVVNGGARASMTELEQLRVQLEKEKNDEIA